MSPPASSRRRHRTTGRFRVALAVPQGLPFLERVLHGIAEYARENGSWTFTRLPEALGASTEWLRHWSGDGAFVLAVSESDVRTARQLRFPVVNLASHLAQCGLPTVVVDHRQIGEIAAEHLLDRRFRRLGYYGAAGLWYSELRRDGFAHAVARAGGSCDVLEAKAGAATRGTWRNQARDLEKWLRGLRPPVGIMASTDLRAGMVLEACRSLRLRVPEDVAVIGVDNDPVIAEFETPPLTSVSRNDQQVGREAAAMLAALMQERHGRRRAGPGVVFVPPDGIVQRGSTQTVAIEDPIIAKAVQYIRSNLAARLRVPDLLRGLPVSRRAFEYRFRAVLGSSPRAYVNATRIETARRLLLDPSRPKIAAVATACGFSSSRRFRHVFRAASGRTPAAYRAAAKASR